MFKGKIMASTVTPTLDDDDRQAEFIRIATSLRLRGYTVNVVGNGWMISRWNLAHYAAGLDELEAFSRRVGASP